MRAKWLQSCPTLCDPMACKFIHLSIDRHLDHVYILAIVNNAAHVSVQISVQVPASNSFGEKPRRGIGRSYDNVYF